MSEEYSGWLSEINDHAEQTAEEGLSTSNLTAHTAAMTAAVPRKQKALSVMEELEQEMKLLHWHKLANEAALKAALIRSKRLKAKDNKVMVQTARQQERAVWIQKVLEEEQQKPLEVTDEFIREYEAQERKDEQRLESEVSRHIKSLTKLRTDLVKRAEEKARYARYKEKKKALGPPPTKLEDFAEGRVLAGSRAGTPTSRSGTPFSMGTPGRSPTGRGGGGGGGGGGAPDGAAPNVLQSLNKLVELEQRIASLETAAPYDPVGEEVGVTPRSRGGSGAGFRGTAMTFTKKRTATGRNAPAKTVFAVKVVDRSMLPSKRLGRTGVRTLGASRQPRLVGASTRRRATNRNATTQHGARQRRQDAVIHSWLADKQAKQVARKQRMQANTARNSRRGGKGPSGTNNWVRQRDQRNGAAGGGGGGGGGGTGPRRRIMAGSNTGGARPRRPAPGRGGKHMAAFRDMRQSFEARKQAARYGGGGAGGGTRRTAPTRRRTGPMASTARPRRPLPRNSSRMVRTTGPRGAAPMGARGQRRTTRPSPVRSGSVGSAGSRGSRGSRGSYGSRASNGGTRRPAWGASSRRTGAAPARLTPAQRRAKGIKSRRPGAASSAVLGLSGRRV